MAALALVGYEEASEFFLFRQLLYSALEFRAFHASMVGQNCPDVKNPPGDVEQLLERRWTAKGPPKQKRPSRLGVCRSEISLNARSASVEGCRGEVFAIQSTIANEAKWFLV